MSGHPLLLQAALDAARHWRFTPTLSNGPPLRAVGVLTFNFAPGRKASVNASPTASSLSPKEQRRQESLAKLHPSVLAIVVRLESRAATPGADETKFVHDGKAELEVWLTEKFDAAIESLKKLGFEVALNPQSSRLLIGRLPIENLMALADLSSVRQVAPTAALSHK